MSDDEDPLSRAKTPVSPLSVSETSPRAKNATMSWFKSLLRSKTTNSNQIQEVIDEYIEELKGTDDDTTAAESQMQFLTNVIRTQDLRVYDVMIPRADITAIEVNATAEDLKKLFEQHQFSRIPVYRDSLDQVVGLIHIKDILIRMLDNKPYTLSELVREAMIVSPGIPVMDLFLMMREDKKHMALVVDEHGGIDGLVTMNDVIEVIVGDLEDEFDNEEQPQIIEKPDGSLVADARMDVEEFEDRYGSFMSPEEREEVDTLGGLVIDIAGRLPKRGESFKHSSGMVLEVADADSRRVKRLRVRNLPSVVMDDEV